MRINKLKKGDILTYRNRPYIHFVNKPIKYPSYYDDNFNHCNDDGLDIMKIQRFVGTPHFRILKTIYRRK